MPEALGLSDDDRIGVGRAFGGARGDVDAAEDDGDSCGAVGVGDGVGPAGGLGEHADADEVGGWQAIQGDGVEEIVGVLDASEARGVRSEHAYREAAHESGVLVGGRDQADEHEARVSPKGAEGKTWVGATGLGVHAWLGSW